MEGFILYVFQRIRCIDVSCSVRSQVRVIPLELQRLFSHLLLVDELTASTTDLTDSFGWTNNEVQRLYDQYLAGTFHVTVTNCKNSPFVVIWG